jgi:hypothetical protein
MHDLRREGLLSLANAFPMLRDFQYTHTSDPSDEERITCQDIVRAVEPLRETLRRLAVSVLTEPEREEDSD